MIWSTRIKLFYREKFSGKTYTHRNRLNLSSPEPGKNTVLFLISWEAKPSQPIELVPRSSINVSTFPWKIPVGGRGGAEGEVLSRKAGALPTTSFSSLSALTQTWLKRGSSSSGVKGVLSRVATSLLGSQGNKLPHFPRPETIPFASPPGRGLKMPHTIKILMCKALLQALTFKLKVDYPMA